MEALFERQNELSDKINNAAINFGKDSVNRKTEDYIQRRVEAIDNMWSEFHGNNMKLANAEPSLAAQAAELYETVQQRYEQFRQTLVTFTPTPRPKGRILTEERSASSRADELKCQQATNFRAFLRVIRGIDINVMSEKWELEDKLHMLQQRWKTVDDLHWQIDNLLMGSDSSYEQEYTQHEATYEATKKLLNKKLSSTSHMQQSMPKIDIPVFTGNYTQWPTFMDLYTETIHNNPALTKSQKMQHLKGKLKGEAERLVQHLHITAENYDTCWELLSYRYNNVQLLFTKQVQLLMNQPSIHKQNAYELKRLYDTSMEAVHAIHNLGVETSTWDPILVHIIAEKLDSDTFTSYMESRKAPRDLPAFDEFMTFLESKFAALEPMNKSRKSSTQSPAAIHKPVGVKQEFPSKSFQYTNNKGKNQYTSYHVTSDRRCPLCKVDHILFHCKTFQGMAPEAKHKTIEQLHICPNCLYCHNEKPCNSRKRCKVCNGQHNTILHDLYKQPEPMPSMPRQQNGVRATNSPSSSNHVSNPDNEVLLSTVLLNIRSQDGTKIHMRALIDQGSQISLITENAAQRLGLQRRQHSGTISGVGSSLNKSKGIVTLTCESPHSGYQFTTEALVMTKMLNKLPNNTFKKQHWPHLHGIQLADPDYNISRSVDILLDASVYSDIIMDGILRGPAQAPLAQQTKIGWILFGNTKTFNCHVVLNNIEDLSRFWEMEEIAEDNKTNYTAEEEYCERLYKATTTRMLDGRYQVKIPMKQNYEQHLGISKTQAVAQFLQVERKMTREPLFRSQYTKFIDEYIELGHMKPCSIPRSPSFYLPHHAVKKLDSTTTQLRVVFSGSSRTQSGQSLNELMLSGPNLQQDLQTMLLRWRKYKYVYTADIEKFYRQIMVHEEDQHLQKIIWRNSEKEPLTDYLLCTVTYGTRAAAFLSMRTIKQLITDEGHKYPLACDTLNNQLYVDDLLGGHDDIDLAQQTQQQLIKMLQEGGFNLRKWASNETKLLKNLSQQQISASMLDFKHTQTNKALGLRWNPETDNFTFKQKIHCDNDSTKIVTKRTLLSDIATLYDPLGWLSPVTVKAKLIFQKVWESGVNWDDPLADDIQREWKLFKTDMPNIEKVIIPRWVGNTTQRIELHGFCDSSEKAYSCVIYCKTIPNNEETHIRLVTAKTKLAPLKKPVSIPRLELLGALLLSRLMEKVCEALTGHDVTIYGWTDSMVVLGWLQGDAARWKTFVANRVTKIVAVMPSTCWRHVKSEQNPSDCASRGLLPSQLVDNKLWWEAPTWLKNKMTQEQQTYETPNLEIKTKQTCATQQCQESNLLQQLINKYSSITRLIRVTCWILRFITNTRDKVNALRTNYLTTKEIQDAHTAIMKTAQLDFIEDIARLRKNGAVSCKSNLINLNPILDSHSLLCVGGRIKHSRLQPTSKHPIILAKRSKVTEMLIEHAHKVTLHAGPKLTLGYLRNKYWILGGYGRVAEQVRKCVKCIRFKSSNNNQLMADLPEPRVTPSRAFTHCGVDFTGHVEVKANKGRGIKTTKGYIAVFVCLSTKAVHLELVSDLTSSAFIAAFKRMCARRGPPKHMYSDNGTNFSGSAKILARENREARQHYMGTEFMEYIATEEIVWHFNAPAWPSANGLCESAVRLMKHHLKRVLGEQKLTFEEFTTLLADIEACLNSRPLTTLKEDGEDMNFLTPSHFLVGDSILSAPSGPEVEDIRTRWQLVEKMRRDFWKQWSSEYLHTLQSRDKWNTKRRNIEVGEVVVIKEDNSPPARWLLGRVQEIHPGKDGLVRVVTLKTKNGTTKRPIVKLAPLHVNADHTTKTNVQPSSSSTTTTPANKNSKQCNSMARYLLTTLLVLATIIPPSMGQLYNITSLDSTKPVYFDKIANIHIIQDQWKIVVYYNLTTYKYSLRNIEDYVNHLHSVCNSEPAFLSISSQLQHEVNELKHNDKLLQLEHATRKRRGLINGIGYLANSLFGVLDERFAEQYKHDIKLIQKNENHVKKLYQQQTSIIEGEYNLLKRNENVMSKQYQIINKHLYDLQTQEYRLENQHKNAMYATSSTLAAAVIIASLHRVQDSLIDMVTDLRNGRVDVHLLGPTELLKQLRIITSQLPSDMTLPNYNNETTLRNIYKVLRVHSRLTDEFLIFEVKLPLLNIDRYELHDIIPIPQQRNSRCISIIPTSKYVAIDLRKDMFITMNSDQLHTCSTIDDAHMLCPLKQPIYNIKGIDANCEAQIINNNNLTKCKTEISACADKWVQLHGGAAWLFSCCQECAVRIFCATGVTSNTLQGTGLITLGQGCLLKHDSFTIPAHLSRQSTVMEMNQNELKIIVPPPPEINHLINNASTLLDATENHAELLRELKDKLDDVKKQQADIVNDDTVSFHDVHQYALIYITISIAFALLIYRGARKILKIKRRCPQPQPDQTPHIEMTDPSYEMQILQTAASSETTQRRSTTDAATSPTMSRESRKY